MGTALTNGGWVQERPVPTGGSNNVIRLVGGCVAAAAAALSALGTGGELSVKQLLRTAQLELHGASSFEMKKPTRFGRLVKIWLVFGKS